VCASAWVVVRACVRICVGGYLTRSKYKHVMSERTLIHKLIITYDYNNKMANNSSLKVGIIQWDILLDKMEQLIRSERCICCRTIEYWMIDPTNAFHSMYVPVFHDIHLAYSKVFTIAQEVHPVYPLERRYHHHRHNHGHDKTFIRELLDAERNLLVAMHFHPLLADMHVCFMNYHAAAHYGVELIACDEVFVTHQTVSYMKCLDKVRDMFE
jgi:hypothetical protein